MKITPELVSALDDAVMSNYKATSVVLSVAKWLGIDINSINVSQSTLHRSREKIRKEIDNQVKKVFGENLEDNSFIVLHWDGKILAKWSAVDGKTDRLAVVVSNGNDTKILGAAELDNGSAINQFNAIEVMLNEWNIGHHIKAICCDTTSTNTGEKQGICARLRKKYNDELLTVPCRRDILELVISKAYSIALNDNSQSPNITLFERFKAEWNTIDATKTEDMTKFDKVKKAIDSTERQAIITFVRQQLVFQKPQRHNYIEFLELI